MCREAAWAELTAQVTSVVAVQSETHGIYIVRQPEGCFFLCTRGGKEMWPFTRPRPGTASRGKDLPYSIDGIFMRNRINAYKTSHKPASDHPLQAFLINYSKVPLIKNQESHVTLYR